MNCMGGREQIWVGSEGGVALGGVGEGVNMIKTQEQTINKNITLKN